MSNLTKIRGKHVLTQEALGRTLGIGRAGMSYMEKYPLSAKNAVKVAEVLNENVFAILGSDVLKIKPSTEEDKTILIEMIKSL